MKVSSFEKQKMILPTIKSLCKWFKPELIDVMLSYFLVVGKEVKNNLELSRMQAGVLLHLIVKTKSERTEELAQCPELLYKSTSESRFLFDAVLGDS